jgi:hypothetical protein
MQASELQQQMTQPVILCLESIALQRQCIALGHHRQHQRPQCIDAFGQALHVVAWRIHTHESYAATDGLRIPFAV